MKYVCVYVRVRPREAAMPTDKYSLGYRVRRLVLAIGTLLRSQGIHYLQQL
jgi:hypothetical protein